MTANHGTRGRYWQGCRCADCSTAHARYLKAWRNRTHYGREGGTHVALDPIHVDAGPTADHVAALLASGWTNRALAQEAGVWHSLLTRLTQRTSRRIHRDHAAALLALEPLTPVDVDPVVVERLMAGADWRTLGATRVERIAAAERLPVKAEVERHLGLRVGRDYTPRSVAS